MDARYRLSSDPADIDRARVHRWLSDDSYWATGRSRERQDAAIDGSRCFVALEAETGEQVAFARVVTDGATFAWLCDVYVDREHRGAGVGTALMEFVVRELEALDLRRWVLRTGDAHGLYERFGFTEPEQPETWMARELPGGGTR
ncbi:GNAT family N-acetyltransferase [Homoserinibacter gongjuensis]|jgi:GNAT superfamily N-acetyltransferase|uniref:N-acetyltransferase n=1 Tax=Homoserinibacter gongjuensis TaxID=1162968 RepID=A0ABQ6JP97_9MICO|nr:GNAT family N-acetyltransferase [Homoserinibacter gongjuensis]GMA89918.1 N-acetyltransferase [Homoserinibacter gongjuensis]